jgi:beta-lactamase class A
MVRRKKRLPLKNRRDMVVIGVVGAAVLGVVLIQQLLPSGKPVPFARIGNTFTRDTDTESIQKRYQERLEANLTLHAGDVSKTYPIKNLGVSFEFADLEKNLQVESRLKRLIPFSSLYQMLRNHEPSVITNEKSLMIVLQTLADEVNIEPINASLVIDQGTTVVSPGSVGSKFEPTESVYLVVSAVANSNDNVRIGLDIAQPEITTAELELATRAFIDSLPQTLTIDVNNAPIEVDRNRMIAWLTFTIVDGQLVMSFDQGKVQEFADQIATEYGNLRRPTFTTVTLVDGKETSRIDGRAGQIIDAEKLVIDILEAIDQKKTIVVARVSDVPSPIKYIRNYTQSAGGLQNLLNNLTEGNDISIRFVDLGGRGWDVGSKQNERFRMASTYKLFVAYSVLKRVDAGSMSLSDTINGYTVDRCMQKMIIDSDNDCAVALAEQIGWQVVEGEGRAIGATGLDGQMPHMVRRTT